MIRALASISGAIVWLGATGVLGAAEALAQLPANAWVEAGRNAAGARRGAAVVWLEREQRFLVVGGLQANEWTVKAKIPAAPALMTFDPATRQWAEFKLAEVADAKGRGLMLRNDRGELALNSGAEIAGVTAWDADKRHLYVYGDVDEKSFNIYRLNLDAGKWEHLSGVKPPADAGGRVAQEFGYGTIFMAGAATVFDPVNGELLFIGGRTADHPQGFVGNWAFSVANKSWRELKAVAPLLDPLQAKAAALALAVRGAENAARNVMFAGSSAAEQARALRGRPTELAGEARKQIAALRAELAAAKAAGWQAAALKLALARVTAALAGVERAAEGFAGGQVSAELLQGAFAAAWSLDEAAGALRSAPGARESAGVAYDPLARAIVVFGGNHGDYLLGDTWIYDCVTGNWRQLFPDPSPAPRAASGNLLWLPKARRVALAGGETYVPRFVYFQRAMQRLSDTWTLDVAAGQWTVTADSGKDAPQLSCRLAAGDDDLLLGLAHKGQYGDQVASYHLMRVTSAGAPSATGVAAGTRTYLSVVPEYDPRWFDAAERGDPKVVESFLSGLQPNAWAPVPRAPRPAAQRDWGTAIFDPERDQWYHWTGGHMADPSTAMSTYHPGLNRWSLPYVAEYLDKGLTFNGRPDCRNHTYLTYAYDPVSKKLVCSHIAGTSLYDPDRGEFEPPIAQPFKQHTYVTATISTPRGVIGWHPGFFGLLDVARRAWTNLAYTGAMPWPATDGTAAVYDSRRDAIWLAPFAGYQKPSGQIWRYDMKSGAVAAMNPAGQEEIGKGPAFMKKSVRETVYLPQADLVLFNNFMQDRMVAYDPAKNRWCLTSIVKCPGELGGVSIGMMYDARRNLVWAQSNSQRMYVLKVDTATLTLADAAGQQSDQP